MTSFSMAKVVPVGAGGDRPRERQDRQRERPDHQVRARASQNADLGSSGSPSGICCACHRVWSTTSLACPGEFGLPWSDDSLTYYDPDLRRLAVEETQVDGPPGQAFLYNNYNPLLVGLALERATGQIAASYLEQHLWQPIGAEYGASWSLDSKVDAFEKMESGINARAIDYAKFGLLYLRHGRWRDQQLIPADWVRESITLQSAPGSPSGTRYGCFWWIFTGDSATRAEPRFFARGNLGQFIFIAPDKDLVIVRRGREFGYEHWNELLDRLANEIATARSSARASQVRAP
jgi:CubicO group peptidase (beta-lactamase class C family)